MTMLGIVSVNSLDFVNKAFEAYTNSRPIVFLRAEDDFDRIGYFNIREVYCPSEKFGWFSWKGKLPTDDSLAQISFTSGTESKPKGVQLTHANLDDVTQRVNLAMEVNSTIKEYVGVPINYSFGLGRFRAVCVAGGKAYLPPNGFDILELREMLRDKQVNALSAVPSLLRVLIKGRTLFGDEVKEIGWIEIGSQFMSVEEKQEIIKIFPNAKIVQHYGLTEASRTSLLRLDLADKEQLGSVGRIYKNTEIKITRDNKIAIKGPHVSRAYLVDGIERSTLDESGWFITNDLGHVRDGYLYFDGRADDLINCGGRKISPEALEEQVRIETAIINGFAICGVPSADYGDAILLTIDSSIGDTQFERIKSCIYKDLDFAGIKGRGVLKFQKRTAIPVTETGKVKRSELKRYFVEASLYAPGDDVEETERYLDESTFTDSEKKVIGFLANVLTISKSSDLDRSFYDLGGDSLSALTSIVELEKKNAPPAIARGIMRGMTIREIAGSLEVSFKPAAPNVGERPELTTSFSINVVRGFLALCVVFAHWSTGILERLPHGADFLKVILAPLLGIGTPGFSVIYGVSLGYSLYSVYIGDKTRFFEIRNKTLFVLTIGIVTLAAIKCAEVFFTTERLTGFQFFSSFYSVLTYYWLMTLLLGLFFRVAMAIRHSEASFLIFACLSYVLDRWLVGVLVYDDLPGPVELLKLLFVAKYSYFNMLTGTCIGFAVGCKLFSMKKSGDQSLGFLLPYGVLGVLLGMIISFYASDFGGWLLWPVYTNTIWRWIFFAGLVFFALGGVHYIWRLRSQQLPRYVREGFRVLSVSGVLAFPLFILHELVLPLKSIFVFGLGFSNAIGLGTAMLLFLATFGIAFRRIYLVNYSK